MYKKEVQMDKNITIARTYTEKELLQFAEFLVKYQLEADGSIKALPTAINEVRERIQYDDFTVRAENSVDGKIHVFSFTSNK